MTLRVLLAADNRTFHRGCRTALLREGICVEPKGSDQGSRGLLGMRVKTAEPHHMRIMTEVDVRETAGLVRDGIGRGLFLL